jgi:pimeloyl-ACP methyl ester carboxylesterase
MHPLPLLLLHGALGDARQLHPLAKQITDRKVVCVNFPGHGPDAGNSVPFTMHDLSETIATALDEQRIDQADAFGYSMGGYAALWFLRSHPTRIRRLFTLGTKFSWTPETAASEQRFLNPDKIKEKVPRLATLLSKRHGEANWERVLGSTAAMIQWLGAHPLNEQDFHGITQTVCLGLGDQDNMVTLEETLRVAGLLKNGSVSSLAGTPHGFEQVDSGLLRDVLLRFLS